MLQIDDSENSNDTKHPESEKVTEKEKVRIDFPFSETVRNQIPNVFETAESVATEVKHHWNNEGDFSNLGLPNPLADYVASQALQKVKQVEKKLAEKGVINLAKMGFEIAKSQIENLKKKL